ncbi:MAG TPA: DUF1003 domain-containing protein [Myxococcota bacterium]|jgi:uncharacterized membrane protein
MHGLTWILAGLAGSTALVIAARLIARAMPRAVARREHHPWVARDTNLEFDEKLTAGQRMADRLASFGGSWTFITLFFGTLLAWIGYNLERPVSFDPYPFILLNLVLSCLAAIQAPVILMSQNRMSAKDRIDARHDYEVNLKAEMEISALHAKLDGLAQREWARLLEIQQRQIDTLARIERLLADRTSPGG